MTAFCFFIPHVTRQACEAKLFIKKPKLREMCILNIEVYYINTKKPSTWIVSKAFLLILPEIYPVFRNYSYMAERMQKYLEVYMKVFAIIIKLLKDHH